MMRIEIYVEGGGDTTAQRSKLREGLDALLGTQKEAARARRIGWTLTMAGSRHQAFRAFLAATRNNSRALAVLVVDAEEAVADATPEGRVAHLKARDGWKFDDVDASRVHLMIQCMEAWLVADGERLAEYYGQHFSSNALPKRQVLDEEPKASLYSALEAATKRTQKGHYGKVKHASALLKLIRPRIVEQRCVSFRQLTQWLDAAIQKA